MPTARIKNFLDENRIHYKFIPHSEAFTAIETAQRSHIDPSHMAKTVIVRAPDKLFMVILQANHQLDLDLLSKATGETHLDIAREQEFSDKFSDCEIGAMPPLGNLYDMDVYLADDLIQQDRIVFNAGNHRELIEIALADFKRLAHPKIIHVT